MKKVTLLAVFICFVAAGIFYSIKADAVIDNANMNISATVPTTCAFTTEPMDFGAYLSLQAGSVEANGKINVNCVAVPFTIDIYDGNNPSLGQTAGDRSMNNGGISNVAPFDYLNYDLFWDVGLATPAGLACCGGTTSGGTGDLTWQAFTVYGTIPGSQDVNPGTYTDTVVVELSY